MKTCSALPVAMVLVALLPLSAMAEKSPPDVTLTGHKSPILDVAFSPDGKRLASVADDGLLKIWDVAAKKELYNFEGAKNNRNQVRFTPDGNSIVVLGSDQNLLVFDARSGKPRKPILLPNLSGGPAAFDLSPDGKTLAVVGRGTLRLIDLATGAPTAEYEVHKAHAASAVAYSHDGRRLATVGSDHAALVIEIAIAKVIRSFDLGYDANVVALSRDGQMLFAYSDDRLVRSFNVASGEAQTLVDKMVPILSMSLSNDGKTLVLGGVGRAPWLLSLPDGKLVDNAYDSEDRVKAANISPDGKWLAGGANEGAIYLWKTGN